MSSAGEEPQPSSSHATNSPDVNKTGESTELMDYSFTALTDRSLTFQLKLTDDSLVSYLAGYAMMKSYKQLEYQNCSTAYEIPVA